MSQNSKYAFRYEPEHIEYLREHAEGISNKELTRMFNEYFGTEKSTQQISGTKKRYGIKSGLDGRFQKGCVSWNKGRKVPPEVYEKMKNSNTWYPKGHQPHNHLPLNSLKKDSDYGYWYRKYSMDGKKKQDRWVLVHHEIWTKAHGPIPDDCVVIFLDGNPDNLTLENLAMIKRSTHARLNQMHLRFNDQDTTRTAITHAQLKEAIIGIEKNKRKRRKRKTENK